MINNKSFTRFGIIVLLLVAIWLGMSSEVEAGGLVPCGVERPCSICDIAILARNILNFLLQLVASVAGLSIVLGGVMMVISSANPALYKQGLTVIQYAVIGLIFSAAVFLIFGFILTALGYQEANFEDILTFEEGSFFSVTCSTETNFNDEGRSFGIEPGE